MNGMQGHGGHSHHGGGLHHMLWYLFFMHFSLGRIAFFALIIIVLGGGA